MPSVKIYSPFSPLHETLEQLATLAIAQLGPVGQVLTRPLFGGPIIIIIIFLGLASTSQRK